MASKGLGRGLSALIPDENFDENLLYEKQDGILKVDINKIKPNKNQPRKQFDKEKLDELARSITEHGIIQPLVVIKEGKDYIIVAGERRYKASLIAGLKEVPVIVKDFDENRLLQVALIENIQREDLNELEKAFSFKELKEKFNLTQDEIAKKISKSRASIANTLRLLTLNEEVKELLKGDKIKAGHARAILSVEETNLHTDFANKIVKDNLSVRQAEELAKTFKAEKEKPKKEKKKDDPHVINTQNNLSNLLGTKVKINNKGEKGSIQIDYYSKGDLDRIINMIFNSLEEEK